jgi:antitoxin component YwqK of YwqJK toxin-antitoxin module
MIKVKKEYYTNGNIRFEEYKLNDLIHRDNGPAITEYHDNGNIKCKHYYMNGALHKEDGPAIVYYYHNKNVWIEVYYLNGSLHREDGPAHISYYEDKYIIYWKAYYLNGDHLTEQEWFNQLSIEDKLKLAYGIYND